MLRALVGLRDMNFQPGGPHADAFLAYAGTLRDAYSERLKSMGETSDQRDPSTTTHLNVIDRDGNMVANRNTRPAQIASRRPAVSCLWFIFRAIVPSCNGPCCFSPSGRSSRSACCCAPRAKHSCLQSVL
jgi:hypothetical protein